MIEDQKHPEEKIVRVDLRVVAGSLADRVIGMVMNNNGGDCKAAVQEIMDRGIRAIAQQESESWN